MNTHRNKFILVSAGLLVSGVANAASGPAAEFINYYKIILSSLGLDANTIGSWVPVAGALFTLTITFLIGSAYSKAVAASAEDISPDGKIGLRAIVESILEFVHNLGKDIIGEKECKSFLPLLVGLFLFIFISNLSGLVPGFFPATESIDTNLAMGLIVFVVFNYAGVKEHGLTNYLKTFAGPVAAMMPLIFCIEMVGAFARPISLSLRLYGNIFGDHLVLSVFTGLTYLLLPSFLLFFGLLVATLQSFVFTLLSSIYISIAISHDH